MLSADQTHDVFARIQKLSSADEVEAIIAGGRSALTRFANNTIHQNVAEEGYVISIRVALDGKTARATTNRIDDESLRRAVQAAEQIARVQQSDPDLLPSPSADEAQQGEEQGEKVQRHFDATAAITAEHRAAAVEQIVTVAKKHRQTTAGIYSPAESLEALLHSRGLARIPRQNNSEGSLTMVLHDAYGGPKTRVPRRRVTLVEKGVVHSLVYARATARKMQRSELAPKVGKVQPTGHGFPLPNELGDAPMNIVVEGGNTSAKSVEEMVASTERGVLVTRLWYIREVD